MKKDHLRDYCTEMYRFWSRVGGKENYIEQLRYDMQRQRGSGVQNPVEAEVLSRDKVIEVKAVEFADIEAVERVMDILAQVPEGRCVRLAIEYVYFRDARNELFRGDIVDRVHRAVINIPASESQVYRWLKKARVLLARERGLRL